MKRFVPIVLSAMILFWSVAFAESTDVKIKSLSVDKKDLPMCVFMKYTPEVTIEPSDATNTTLEWTSSNENIATVSEDGQIYAKDYGKCTITAKATDGSGKSVKINVEVQQRYISSKNIEIDSLDGAYLDTQFGSGIITTSAKGDCFTTERIDLDDFDSMLTRIERTHIIPVKPGKASIIYTINGKTKITVNITVKQSLYDGLKNELKEIIANDPARNTNPYEGNEILKSAKELLNKESEYVGQTIALKGTVRFIREMDVSRMLSYDEAVKGRAYGYIYLYTDKVYDRMLAFEYDYINNIPVDTEVTVYGVVGSYISYGFDGTTLPLLKDVYIEFK